MWQAIIDATSDTVLLELIKSLFWLAVVVLIAVVVVIFLVPISRRIETISSVKIAGASFELGNRQETFEAYAVLGDIQLDILSDFNRVDDVLRVIRPPDVEKLGVFAGKYIEQLQKEKWNLEMLSSVAYLLSKCGRWREAIELCDRVLIRSPNNGRFEDCKGLALMFSGLKANFEIADGIYSNLMARPFANQVTMFRAAVCKLWADKLDEGFKLLEVLARGNFAKVYGVHGHAGFLDDPFLSKFRVEYPAKLAALQMLLETEAAGESSRPDWQELAQPRRC